MHMIIKIYIYKKEFYMKFLQIQSFLRLVHWMYLLPSMDGKNVIIMQSTKLQWKRREWCPGYLGKLPF